MLEGHSRRALRSCGVRLAGVDARDLGITLRRVCICRWPAAIWFAIGSRAWGLLFFGILGVTVGVYTFFYPGVTTVLVADPGAGALAMFFALMFGVMMIVLAFRVRGLPKRLERLREATTNVAAR